MLVYDHQIVFEVVRDLVQVEEDLLEVLLDQREQAHQFHVAKSAHNVVRDRVELVSDQKRELYVELAQSVIIVLTAARGRHLLQFNLPVAESAFHEKVEADKELDHFLILSAFLDVQAMSKMVHLKYLSRQPIHLLLLEQIHEELLLIDRLK